MPSEILALFLLGQYWGIALKSLPVESTSIRILALVQVLSPPFPIQHPDNVLEKSTEDVPGALHHVGDFEEAPGFWLWMQPFGE